MTRPIPAVERVFRKIIRHENGCWEWFGSKTDGYGRIGVGSRRDGTLRQEYVHRVVYESFNGPIPAGLQIDHLCRNRACVRLAHLRAVSLTENVMAPGSLCVQKRNSDKTHCVRGHELSGANVKAQTVKGVVWRHCRTCIRASERKVAR
jgi:hypothetical protein